MKEKIDSESACHLLDLAHKYCCDELIEFCMNYIANYTESVLQSKSFLNISKDTLKCILEYDKLDVDESDIFDGLVKWGKARVNENPSISLKMAVEELLPLIRFPLMNPHYLIDIVEPLKIVDKDLLLEAYRFPFKVNYLISIYRYISAPEKSKGSERTKPRRGTNFKGSSILSSQQKKILDNWCGTYQTDDKWVLQYKATRDGFNSKTFHKLCDNKVYLLIILIKIGTYRLCISNYRWIHFW